MLNCSPLFSVFRNIRPPSPDHLCGNLSTFHFIHLTISTAANMSDTPMPDTEGWGDEHWSEFIRANGNWIVPHLQLNFHRLPRKAQRKLRKIAEQIILSSDEDTEVTSNKKHKSTHITAPEMDVKPEQGTGEEPTSGDDGNALRRPRGTSSKGKVIHASEPAEEQVKGRTTRPGDETDGPKERATVTG